MSRIDELIQQLCPDGVEYKPLGELCFLSRGKVISKDYLRDHPGIYPVFSSQTADDGVFGRIDSFEYDGEYLTWTTDGANAGSVFFRSGRFNITNVCGLIKLKLPEIRLRFLFYWLRVVAPSYVNAGMGNPKLMSNVMGTIQCPVPPLPVQKEIVRILDKFTALEAELEAELEARRKQYEFYRDQLLNFKGLMSRGAGSLVSLGDLFDFKNGLNKSKEFFGSGYPIVNFTDVFKKNHLYATDLKGRVQVTADEISRYSVQKGDVFFTRTSETREEIGMASVVLDDIGDCVFSGFVLRARPKTTLLLPQYCGFCFRHNDVRKQIIQRASFTTRALTSGTALAKIQIPVPPLTEQERIVAILDKFDALINDISSGLPAELEMRRKQYEYYRDRLLTFKPLAKEA